MTSDFLQISFPLDRMKSVLTINVVCESNIFSKSRKNAETFLYCRNMGL